MGQFIEDLNCGVTNIQSEQCPEEQIAKEE